MVRPGEARTGPLRHGGDATRPGRRDGGPLREPPGTAVVDREVSVTRVSDEHDPAGDAALDRRRPSTSTSTVEIDEDDRTSRRESHPVDTARRRHGTAGAVLAAGLLGIDIALGRKPKEEVPVVVDAPTGADRHRHRRHPRRRRRGHHRRSRPALPRSDPLAHSTRRRRRGAAPAMTMRRSRLGALVLGASLALMAIPSAAAGRRRAPITAPADVVTGPTDPAPIEPAEADAGATAAVARRSRPPDLRPGAARRHRRRHAVARRVPPHRRRRGPHRPRRCRRRRRSPRSAARSPARCPAPSCRRRCRSRDRRAGARARASTSSRRHARSTSARSGSRRSASAPTVTDGVAGMNAAAWQDAGIRGAGVRDRDHRLLHRRRSGTPTEDGPLPTVANGHTFCLDSSASGLCNADGSINGAIRRSATAWPSPRSSRTWPPTPTCTSPRSARSATCVPRSTGSPTAA